MVPSSGPASGPQTYSISLAGNATSGGFNQSADIELGNSYNTTISLGDSSVRTLTGISSGAISMYDLYGKSNRKTLTITFASNQSGAVAYLNTISGYVTGKTDFIINVNSNVIVYGYGANQAGLTITGGNAGDTVTLNNYGYIMGAGGAGGDSLYSCIYVPPTNTLAAYGHDGAFGLDYSGMSTGVTFNYINNAGWITGGGGGGGASYVTGSLGCSCNCDLVYYDSFLGGGGGAGGGHGGLATRSCGCGSGSGGCGGGPGSAGNLGVFGNGGGGGRYVPPCQAVGGQNNLNGYAGTSRGEGGGAGGAGASDFWCQFPGRWIAGACGGSAGNPGKSIGDVMAWNVYYYADGAGGGGGYGASGGNGFVDSDGSSVPGGVGGPAVRSNGTGVPWLGSNPGNIYGSVS
jgi:hypothetical protein